MVVGHGDTRGVDDEPGAAGGGIQLQTEFRVHEGALGFDLNGRILYLVDTVNASTLVPGWLGCRFCRFRCRLCGLLGRLSPSTSGEGGACQTYKHEQCDKKEHWTKVFHNISFDELDAQYSMLPIGYINF
jgi:hypothetical protein